MADFSEMVYNPNAYDTLYVKQNQNAAADNIQQQTTNTHKVSLETPPDTFEGVNGVKTQKNKNKEKSIPAWLQQLLLVGGTAVATYGIVAGHKVLNKQSIEKAAQNLSGNFRKDVSKEEAKKLVTHDKELLNIDKLENNKELQEIITPNRLSVCGNMENYIYNIKLSETFYPALSLLEVTLRNRICNAIEKHICKDWLLAELRNQNILANREYQKLKEAANKIKKSNQEVTNDRLISELNLGFWTHLCTKSYKSKLWDKKGFFEAVFPNYSNNGNLRNISQIQNDLLAILGFRNRVFHHEIIINSNKTPKEHYQRILNMLHMLSDESSELLNSISRFEKVSRQKP